ncbi:protein of unknown function [Moritella yayanosii]|uniref:Uncharacterized protein n=1 Tax=Moritella yayanosii TaxID=69539 RepID=A0A330LL40_9GAMM|nr:protein of unknown function [Moritella yayanosii]
MLISFIYILKLLPEGESLPLSLDSLQRVLVDKHISRFTLIVNLFL